MKKFTILTLGFLLINSVFSQLDKVAQFEKIKAFQDELNTQFTDPKESPLEEKDRAVFKELEFFPATLDFCFVAKFTRTPQAIPFMMQRTKDQVKYVKYGDATFSSQGKSYTIELYQNLDLIARNPDYKDHLFLPFTDLTNGTSTYGGGRYIDLKIPQGNEIIIDFNQSYNPYCAYNKKYSCPIPPRENDLKIAIEAGVKAFGKH
jgi:uncharacterized protein (DUF1684 family)